MRDYPGRSNLFKGRHFEQEIITLHALLSALQTALLRKSDLVSVAPVGLVFGHMKAAQNHCTTAWETYSEALKARGSLLIWLDPKMD